MLLLPVKSLVFIILILPAIAFSQENILAVMSSNDKIYQSFYTRLKQQLQNNVRLTQINASEVNTHNLDKHKIIITIGHKAATEVSLQKNSIPVIYSLIPDSDTPEEDVQCKHKSCYKVYINQPVSRYVRLFRTIFPESYDLVFVTTQTMTKRSQQLKSAADKDYFEYKEIVTKQNDNIARILLNRLGDRDILLALPDINLYNADNAKNIILSAYHKNVPIIAYSKSFAKAGALISLYSSINDIADKTAGIANDIITNKATTEREFYPDKFSLEINSAVARSLNIDMDSTDNIKRKIE